MRPAKKSEFVQSIIPVPNPGTDVCGEPMNFTVEDGFFDENGNDLNIGGPEGLFFVDRAEAESWFDGNRDRIFVAD